MLLYPTETIYALGVNALEETEVAKLFRLKGREEGKSVSWLVRDMVDVQKYGFVDDKTVKIAKQFLPGPLTLVLRAKDTVPLFRQGAQNEISFRISSDEVAQQVINNFMKEHNAPLTCTSANISGLVTLDTPEAILKQFGEVAADIDTVYDDGVRSGQASTIIRIVDGNIDLLREGSIPFHAILAVVNS